MKKPADIEPVKGDTVNLDGGLDEHDVVSIFHSIQGQRVARIVEVDTGKARVVDFYRIKVAD